MCVSTISPLQDLSFWPANGAASASCCQLPGARGQLSEQCPLTVAYCGFSAGTGVCALPEGDREDSQGHPGHVPGEGHAGSVSERGLGLHRGPPDRS